MNVFCACGCKSIITSKYKDGSYRRYRRGHNSSIIDRDYCKKNDSTNINTGRWRAKKLLNRTECSLKHPLDCKGRIEIHHIDKNPSNNDLGNIIAVCKTHHNFLDRGVITIQDSRIPDFYIDKGGKRRYKTWKVYKKKNTKMIKKSYYDN